MKATPILTLALAAHVATVSGAILSVAGNDTLVGNRPANLITKVVFDQWVFVKNAIENLLHEGAIGLILTGLMILVFLIFMPILKKMR